MARKSSRKLKAKTGRMKKSKATRKGNHKVMAHRRKKTAVATKPAATATAMTTPSEAI